MCGIAGILRAWQRGEAPPRTFDAIPEPWLDVLDESIKHRGPDGCGRFRKRVARPDGTIVDVALVHRRLSIIDHACGAQPMVIGAGATGGSPASAIGASGTGAPGATGGSSASVSGTNPGGQAAGATGDRWPLISRDGMPYGPVHAHVCPKCRPGVVAVVFNGCIYNHRELRRELQAAGHEFFTDHSDTEVLLHGWSQWGEQLPSNLAGMFAAVLWDTDDAGLVLMRDLAGEKPLIGMLHGRHRLTAFSNSAAGLTKLLCVLDRGHPRTTHGRTPYETDPEIRGWVRSGGTSRHLPVMALREVPAASLRRIRTGLGAPNEHEVSWWTPPLRGADSSALVDWPAVLAAGVAECLEADVPVGCFLSGGIDSGLVAALAQQRMRERGQTLRTFTVRMPDPRYDESGAAAITARHLGANHTTLDCEPEPAADLVSLIEQLGLPFGDSSLLPTTWVARATRAHVRVALSGDGGDELFGGYQRHAAASSYRRWRWLLARLPRRAFPGADPKSPLTKLGRLAAAAKSNHFHTLREIFDQRDFESLFPVPPSEPRVREFWGWRSDADDPLLDDFESYLPRDLLRKSDTASMSVSLETRAPLLARGTINHALSMPLTALMPHNQRKGLLRAVARKYLPAEIVDRPKMGFAIPIGEWFRSDYGGMRQLLYDHLESADPFPGLAEAGVELNMDFVRRMLREHDAAGERSLNPWHGRDHSQRLYMLLVLSIWSRWLRGVANGRSDNAP